MMLNLRTAVRSALLVLALGLSVHNPVAAKVPSPVVGVLGAQKEDLADIAKLGKVTVQIPLPADRASFEAALAEANRLGLSLIVSIDQRALIQGEGLTLNTGKLASLLATVVGPSSSDPGLAGVLYVDDPCHRDKRGRKWNLTSAELSAGYTTIKAINPNLSVVVNFSKSTCLDEFVKASPAGAHIADVAILKAFYYKWSTTPGLMDDYAAIARNAKRFDTAMKVVPKLGVYETVGRDASAMPTTAWLEERQAEFRKSGAFDGLFLFNYRAAEPAEVKTMSAVMSDPTWAGALRSLLDGARKQ